MKDNNISLRIKRLRIYGIFGILYSIYLEYDHLFIKKNDLEFILGIFLFICSLFFLIVSIKKNKSHK